MTNEERAKLLESKSSGEREREETTFGLSDLDEREKKKEAEEIALANILGFFLFTSNVDVLNFVENRTSRDWIDFDRRRFDFLPN